MSQLNPSAKSESPDKARRKSSYPPDLGTPYVWAQPTSVELIVASTPERIAELHERYRRKNMEALLTKLYSLAEFHGVAKEGKIDLRGLALKLALAHVAGFSILSAPPPRPGAPRKDEERAALFADVEAVLGQGERSIFNACNILSKRPGRWHKLGAKHLETRYHEHKRKLKRMRSGEIRNQVQELFDVLIREETSSAKSGRTSSATHPVDLRSRLRELFNLKSGPADHENS